MDDKHEMMKQVLSTVRANQGLWPKEFTQAQAENFLAIIEELISPVLNSKGFTISDEDYQNAKQWAESVVEVYIQKNPFQGAFVRPFSVSMFETLDKIWAKRSLQNKEGSGM